MQMGGWIGRQELESFGSWVWVLWGTARCWAPNVRVRVVNGVTQHQGLIRDEMMAWLAGHTGIHRVGLRSQIGSRMEFKFR